jgi:hypothetical protein
MSIIKVNHQYGKRRFRQYVEVNRKPDTKEQTLQKIFWAIMIPLTMYCWSQYMVMEDEIMKKKELKPQVQTVQEVNFCPLEKKEEVKVETKHEIDRAKVIDEWLSNKTKGKSPLIGLGHVFVEEADEHGFDWRLLAAISLAETSGATNGRTCLARHNAWGWASCRVGFSSYEDGIRTIMHKMSNMGCYKGKSLHDQLYAWNGSVRYSYIKEVMDYMNDIYTF